MINIKQYWRKLKYSQKGGIIGALVAIIFFTIFLSDIFSGLSTKIPNQFEFIFYVEFPAVLMGIYGCGWTFGFGDGGGQHFFGDLCDYPVIQLILFFAIYVAVGYIAGAIFGSLIQWLIKNKGGIIKKLKNIIFEK